MEETVISCPYGEKNCNAEDFESICDGCKEDRGQAHAEEMMDTYD